MFSKRFLLALFASAMLLPLSGCGCRKSCCSSGSSSFAPPPCCDGKTLPPSAPFVPGVAP